MHRNTKQAIKNEIWRVLTDVNTALLNGYVAVLVFLGLKKIKDPSGENYFYALSSYLPVIGYKSIKTRKKFAGVVVKRYLKTHPSAHVSELTKLIERFDEFYHGFFIPILKEMAKNDEICYIKVKSKTSISSIRKSHDIILADSKENAEKYREKLNEMQGYLKKHYRAIADQVYDPLLSFMGQKYPGKLVAVLGIGSSFQKTRITKLSDFEMVVIINEIPEADFTVLREEIQTILNKVWIETGKHPYIILKTMESLNELYKKGEFRYLFGIMSGKRLSAKPSFLEFQESVLKKKMELRLSRKTKT